MSRLPFLIAAVFCLASCQPQQDTNKFADGVSVRIADLKDRRHSDSLFIFFESEDPRYRREAVSAFASIQDTVAVERIGELLANDPDSLVRKAAAFALGQTRSAKSADILRAAALAEKQRGVLDEIVEGYGKVCRSWAPLDNEESSGAAGWSLYRAGLRGAADGRNTFAATMLSEGDSVARMASVHFFSRVAKAPDRFLSIISRAALEDPDVHVRMAAAAALGRIKNDSALSIISQIISSADDYRVKVNALRALRDFPFGRTKDYLLAALSDKKANVGIAASEVIRDRATEDSWVELANRVTAIRNTRIQANIYQAVLSVTGSNAVIEEIKSLYRKSADPYQRAALLSALQESPVSHEFVHKELLDADTPVVRSSAASALVAMNRHRNFKPSWKRTFADLYVKAIQTADPAVIGIIAEALADPDLGYREIVADISFLREARKGLSLPRDNEAIQPLEAAIARFEGTSAAPVKNEFNHPVDWDLVRSIPKDAKATIKTSRGNITVRLLVEEAPGSVANFVRLARDDYFDKKFFHRVVPNFVIQAGCNRGDGWGSEDYSIRSEFSPRRYTTGSVGMASAGKDTEGTQWFITHSPAPHLDGRYTIFAEVENGMAAVHLIEAGDRILDVELSLGPPPRGR